jgi:hypothetical protein
MKLWFLALLSMGTTSFCGTAALCQSPGQQKIDPDKLFQMPGKFAQREPDLGKFRPQPFLWNKFVLPDPTLLVPRQDSPQIDPKIIRHPPWRPQSKGHDFAHHLYPGLKFLPLQRGPRIP